MLKLKALTALLAAITFVNASPAPALKPTRTRPAVDDSKFGKQYKKNYVSGHYVRQEGVAVLPEEVAAPTEGASAPIEEFAAPPEVAEVPTDVTEIPLEVAAVPPPNCFPAIGFQMPASVPSSTTNWWCDYNTEYAFVGFSYEVTACQSLTQLRREFLDIRNTFKGRYVRLYGFCDRNGFYNDIIDAAWGAGIGVHALIWFGFDGDTKWIGRRDALFSVLRSNPKAPFVTRTVQFGSEPLYDWAIDAAELAKQVLAAKSTLATQKIPITVSEMAYGYQIHQNDGGPAVMDAIDFVDAHMLPFFSTKASIANNSWPIVQTDINWFVSNAKGKKIYLSQNGWPSTTYPGVEPNSPSAVANVQNEKDYYNLFDSQCSYFKNVAGGGVGWFAHIYSDNQEPGYGIYGTNGALKFPFAPRTSC